MTAAPGVALRSTGIPFADSEPDAAGRVRRLVRCACGAETREFHVHPATHCGLSCLRCTSEDMADGYTLSARVVKYHGTTSEHTVDVRAFRQHDGWYGWTADYSGQTTWDGRPFAPHRRATSGCATLEGAFIEAMATAGGASYNACRAAGTAVRS